MGKPIEACHVAVGARIRIIREALGMTQAELAKRTGLQRASLANLETGRQRLSLDNVERYAFDNVERYAVALGTSPKQLLKGVWW